MKSLQNSWIILLLVVGGLFFISAMPANEVTHKTSKVAENQPITSELALKIVKANLAELEAKPELSKQETRKLHRLKKRIAKIEKVQEGGKSWMVALLLALFLGLLGIHRFYLGYTWQGVVQLLTGGGFFIWAFIDFIRIVIRDLQPNGGSYVD